MSDSMRLSCDEEWMTELSEDWSQETEACLVSSPDKRKAQDEALSFSPSKLLPCLNYDIGNARCRLAKTFW